MSDTPKVEDEARRLLEQITPGEWYVERKYDGGCTIAMMREWRAGSRPGESPAIAVHGPKGWIHGVPDETPRRNAEFIAAAPRLVRDLLAELSRLREEFEYICGHCSLARERAEAAESALASLREEIGRVAREMGRAVEEADSPHGQRSVFSVAVTRWAATLARLSQETPQTEGEK